MKSDYEIGSLVIDGFKVVKYLGYEEHEEDNYHRLLCLEEGEYLASALGGPRNFVGTEAYEEANRLWKLNAPRMIEYLKEKQKVIEDFIKPFKVYEPIISLVVANDGTIRFFDERQNFQYVQYVEVDGYKMEDENYKAFLSNYIEITIKKLLENE
jgi:hypothetical protein